MVPPPYMRAPCLNTPGIRILRRGYTFLDSEPLEGIWLWCLKPTTRPEPEPEPEPERYG